MVLENHSSKPISRSGMMQSMPFQYSPTDKIIWVAWLETMYCLLLVLCSSDALRDLSQSYTLHDLLCWKKHRSCPVNIISLSESIVLKFVYSLYFSVLLYISICSYMTGDILPTKTTNWT